MLASLGRPSLHFMALLTAGLSLTASQSAQAQFQKQYKIVDLADDVFAIVWEDLFAYPAEGNHLIVINEDGVVVVDANRTPSLTDTVIAIIRERTSKLVRHVINTHWHADHVQGNSVYFREFPDVQIIGHPETVAGIDTVLVPWIAEVRSEVVRLRSELEADTTEEGTPLTEEQGQRLKAQLARYERESKLYDAVRLAHPTLLVTDSVVVASGNRKIVVIHPWTRQHTRRPDGLSPIRGDYRGGRHGDEAVPPHGLGFSHGVASRARQRVGARTHRGGARSKPRTSLERSSGSEPRKQSRVSFRERSASGANPRTGRRADPVPE